MTFRTLLIIKAVVCLVFGIFLLAAPAWLFGLLGAAISGTGLFPAREYGAAMIGTLVLCWLEGSRRAMPAQPSSSTCWSTTLSASSSRSPSSCLED